MKLIKPDFHGSVEIEGIAGPVPRPVSIDQAKTGFERLRTLRVYRFSEGVPVDGHAEEDEVLLVVLSGSVELKLTGEGTAVGPVQLDAARSTSGTPCVAYLPPHGEYRLVPSAPADVAYVRARPQSGRPPRVFPRTPASGSRDSNLVFEEMHYAELLRIRIVLGPRLILGTQGDEILLHVQDLPDGTPGTARLATGEQVPISAWDTLAFHSGESPMFQFSEHASPTIFIFSA